MTAPADEPGTSLCFGDSKTWRFNPYGGGRLPYDTRWLNQLQRLLNRDSSGQTWRTVEDGLNSRTWLLVARTALNCGPREPAEQPSAIVLMSPPLMISTPPSPDWGHEGADRKSQALGNRYLQLTSELEVLAFNSQTMVSPSFLDGIHFDIQDQPAIAAALADLIACKLEPGRRQSLL